MEIIADIKSEILTYLDKNISTLVSKETRHSYFQKNGVRLKYHCHDDIPTGQDLLKKYRIKLKICTSFDYYQPCILGQGRKGVTYESPDLLPLERIFSQEILDNIELVDMRKLIHTEINGIENLKNLKRLKMCYTGNNMTEIVKLSSVRAKKSLLFKSSNMVDSEIDVKNIEIISKMDLTIELQLNFHSFDFEWSKKITELLRDKITKIETSENLIYECPNLESLCIDPADLLETEIVYPKLRKIVCTKISETLTDPLLKKYSGLIKYREIVSFKAWDGIDYGLYQTIRPHILSSYVAIPVKYLEMMIKLERKYRESYPWVDKKDLTVLYDHISQISSNEAMIKFHGVEKVFNVKYYEK